MYKTVAFDSSVSDRKREKELQKVKDEIKELLLKFHSGDFTESQLNAWERSVYQQFAGIKDGNKFLEASRRIRAQQGIRENFLAGVKRSYAYLQYIEELFKKEGIPTELKYLPHVESSFNPVARSHVGAAGMWQFMRATGRLYMKVNNIKDERYDPIASTRAAARLLKYNYNELRDWALAITAYNHGLGSMRKAKRQYGTYMKIRENYLRRSFGFASKNFYPEFLAVVEIADSIDYYFPGLEKDPLIVFQEIELPVAVSFPQLAKKHRIDIDELTGLNPGFKSHIYNGSGSVPAGYTLKLPLTADASHILASLGASHDEIREITLVQKTPDREKLVIGKVKDFQLQKKAAEEALALRRIGVESVYRHQVSTIIYPERWALAEPEVPASTPAPLTTTEVLLALNTVTMNLLPDDSYSPLNKPGVEEKPNQSMAAITVFPKPADEAVLPAEIASATPAGFEFVETPSPAGLLAVSKPGVAAGPEESGALLTTTHAFAELLTTAENLADSPPQPSTVTERQTTIVPEDFANTTSDSAAMAERFALLTLVRESNEKNAALSFNKFQVETQVVSRMKRPRALLPTEELSVQENLLAVENESRGESIRFAKAGVEISAGPESLGDNDFAFALGEIAAEQPVNLAQATTTPSMASTPLAARNFRMVDSLLWVEIHGQTAAESWLSSLKPRVEQSRQSPYLPAAAVSSGESESTPASGSYAATSVDFDKQSVESAISYDASDNNWMAVSNIQEEFTLQELAGLLRRRLNSEGNAIHVYPQETLGHYGEWLNISTYQIRRLNNISRNQKIYTGQQLKLDFSHVTPAEFLERRMNYHLELIIKELNGNNKIKLIDHTINSGENLWSLAHKRYNFPVNLLLYFNDFDKLGRLYPGDVIKLPVIYN